MKQKKRHNENGKIKERTKISRLLSSHHPSSSSSSSSFLKERQTIKKILPLSPPLPLTNKKKQTAKKNIMNWGAAVDCRRLAFLLLLLLRWNQIRCLSLSLCPSLTALPLRSSVAVCTHTHTHSSQVPTQKSFPPLGRERERCFPNKTGERERVRGREVCAGGRERSTNTTAE